MHRMANVSERRCRAQNKRGERCAATVVNAAGYCVAHDPERPADMRALGRKSGEARRRPRPERVEQSLRAYLRETVEPSEVWAALKLAMEGQNESARVAASRVLMDALSEPGGDECPKCAANAAGPVVKDNVLTSEQAWDVLEGLEEVGLVAGRERIEERVEKLTEERLQALKQEHGLVSA
jgi:hypothetical protein